jgi:hypothetical protein
MSEKQHERTIHYPPENQPTLEVNGHRYTIGKLSARDGSFILSSFMMSRWAGAEGDFHAFQDKLLAAVSLQNPETGIAVPIMAQNGKLLPQLEHDTEAVVTLTLASFTYSVGPTLRAATPEKDKKNKFEETLAAAGLTLPSFNK